MSSSFIRARAPLAVALALASTPSFAQDQQSSASDMANARALGIEGVQLADRGDCTTAIDRLWRAESLYHAPTILGRLGECQVTLGKLVAGTETLQRVLRDPIGPKSPPAFVAAHDRAQKVLDAALPRIGKLRLHVDSAQTPGLVVKVDGDAVPLAGLDVDRLTDPGSHQVEAVAPGYVTAAQTVALPEGSTAEVTLKLELDPSAAPPPAAAAPPPAPAAAPVAFTTASAAPPAADESGGPSKVGPIALLATGGVGILVGSIFGGMALGKKSALDSACHPKSDCPANSQSNIDSLSTDATISTVGFVVGGLAAAAGGAWLIVGGQSKPKASASASHVVVHPYVGPLSAGMTGAF
ncbi:MAG TPA: hypothetical protein VH062_21020 [Polyangiaceae bacterium]|jgi:hypothetical protein|nr:hypothetical protein [Polyangiaceae bacterium]